MTDPAELIKHDVKQLDAQGLTPFAISTKLKIDIRVVYAVLKGKIEW